MNPSERFRTKEMAAVEVYGKPGSAVAAVKNLSETGACVQWQTKDVVLEVGDLVRMTIVLKAIKREHKVNAQIVWNDGFKSGVRFLSDKQLLDKIIVRSEPSSAA